MGLTIGPGVVENACGSLVAARFKRGGMRISSSNAPVCGPTGRSATWCGGRWPERLARAYAAAGRNGMV